MTVIVTEQSFDPWQEIQNYQNAANLLDGQVGATDVFIGTMRDFNDGSEVQAMTLEHYPGMTEKQLENSVAEARQQWQVLDALVIHRVGDIFPNEAIVLVAVWAAHRGDAFDACRYLMEALKTKAPFWKKERLISADSRWVKENTDGYKSAK
ncbi:MAG: molybdenum cofactor biosynthesis protein MoaE [Methylovulum sp.]|uniref:molybdenum cofactor biosynthesis protein MoaE n=1 Tax=Methylovulum sp. TaxID=1916980 RepID=UPI002623FB3D|nr:molybdenum cofactor biosynthesis protein MoaE [Methylovulum sp.]MDD2724741.1 molybdenum cofactor biosynthesis protein MoaE [Methylovulum sp.]MDD5124752.1 molybdenum cofactor biosynthesis protein MoaE [Methylovulum sp.]